jgi:hypothetical protein
MENFIDSLTHDQGKLIYMGLIKKPKKDALTIQDGKWPFNKKYNKKVKEK